MFKVTFKGWVRWVLLPCLVVSLVLSLCLPPCTQGMRAQSGGGVPVWWMANVRLAHRIWLYIYKKIWNNVFTSMQKLDSHKKNGIRGDCGRMQPPPKKMNMVLKVYILGNMHLVTIWNVCWGRTVTVMENVVKHKSSRYSGRIGFNKCPEILFSEPKKGLIRTLVENICQFLSQKHANKLKSKKSKNQETAKANEPK